MFLPVGLTVMSDVFRLPKATNSTMLEFISMMQQFISLLSVYSPLFALGNTIFKYIYKDRLWLLAFAALAPHPLEHRFSKYCELVRAPFLIGLHQLLWKIALGVSMSAAMCLRARSLLRMMIKIQWKQQS